VVIKAKRCIDTFESMCVAYAFFKFFENQKTDGKTALNIEYVYLCSSCSKHFSLQNI
jgi:hypothetical protein